MKRASTIRQLRKREQGYALILIMFFLAMLAITLVVAAPTVISSVQREKEKEMVWRGRQYTRGIRMYYMKMRRFPTSLDDLTKATNNQRFMRQAYKDPMNTKDGSWRLIYVGPNGQLIGSLNPALTFGMMGTPQGVTPTAAAPQNTSFGGSSSFGSSFTTTSTPGASQSNDPNAQASGASDQLGTPQPIGGMYDASNTIGGNIIGIGSKVDKKSFLWYKKARTYRLFEFIWDPSQDVRVGGASRGIGTPVQNLGNTGAPGTVAPPTNQPNQNLNNMNPDPNANLPLQAPNQ